VKCEVSSVKCVLCEDKYALKTEAADSQKMVMHITFQKTLILWGGGEECQVYETNVNGPAYRSEFLRYQ